MGRQASASALPPGTQLRELRIREHLGGGGSGLVYLADHSLLGATYVVKEFLPRDLATRASDGQVAPLPGKEEQFEHLRKKFLQESRMLQELARPRPHPNLVIIADAFQENGTVYLCMVHEASNTLGDFLAGKPKLDEERISAWLFPLLDGLAHAHARSIWHRDIKPSNILLRDDGSPLLIDFGAARWVHPDSEKTLIRQMTPQFAAPEQVLHGELGPWTDIYGMAATWYYALTGRPPMQRPLPDDWQTPYLERCSERFLDAIDAGLALESGGRPQSITAWLALFGVAPSSPVAAGLRPAKPVDIKPRANPTWGMDTEAITQLGGDIDPGEGEPMGAKSDQSAVASSGLMDARQPRQVSRLAMLLAVGLVAILLAALGLFVWLNS
ncbi:serine/threonine protein kinase [Thiorhodovibrio frisius]|uniref:non-specific serine/threonine protein kinase n=1 Tax=Thiorhodovibrio frisius TaxID=631362 RepID=H8YXW9_9GAMM|nr:serine/threonine-protein kinase [Thiorhodovibrio frisius]EIC23295.1 serine/threonine protein kinase [Thiorhodovibrio frisius]WPL23624.1 Serine/threonine-protein kinase PrkC [Thiorhodovibrio frisius]